MTVLVLDVAVFPVFSFEPTMIAEIEQGIHIIVNDKDDVRAPAAVAAGGAALGDKLFPAKRRLPVAAVSRFHRDGRILLSWKSRTPFKDKGVRQKFVIVRKLSFLI